MNPPQEPSLFTDLSIPPSVTKAPNNGFKLDLPLEAHGVKVWSFPPKKTRISSSFLSGRLSNCSHDLPGCRGCWGPWGCQWVGSAKPPPYKKHTDTTVRTLHRNTKWCLQLNLIVNREAEVFLLSFVINPMYIKEHFNILEYKPIL